MSRFGRAMLAWTCLMLAAWPAHTPPARTFSFDARFAHALLQENLRVVAGGAADRVHEFWNQRQR